MNLLNMIGELLGFKTKETSLERHLRYAQAAHQRTVDAIGRLRSDRIRGGTCPCCVGASYGGIGSTYDMLIKKSERQEVMIRTMEKRLAIRDSQKAPCWVGDL